eukprot:1148411-Pelagomonas_calceolata.AAC.3
MQSQPDDVGMRGANWLICVSAVLAILIGVCPTMSSPQFANDGHFASGQVVCDFISRGYTRIAMGKNTAMDVVTGESSGTSGQLLLLYPLLFGACVPTKDPILQCSQFAIGAGVAYQTFPSLLAPEGWFDVSANGWNTWHSLNHEECSLQRTKH